MQIEPSLLISAAAFALSVGTAWLTLFRRGTLCMTQPTVAYLGADGPLAGNENPHPKVHVRALLYSTGKRGCVVESMYASVRRGETKQTFNIWVYGEKELSRGSGLFVGESGVVHNHHFLLPGDGTKFDFLEGHYEVEIFATLAGSKKPTRLCSLPLLIDRNIAAALAVPSNGAYFSWGPESRSYSVRIEQVPYLQDGRRVLVPDR